MSVRGGLSEELMPLQPQGRVRREAKRWGQSMAQRGQPLRGHTRKRQLSASDFRNWNLKYGGDGGGRGAVVRGFGEQEIETVTLYHVCTCTELDLLSVVTTR